MHRDVSEGPPPTCGRGNGMAAGRMLEELFAHDEQGFDITLIGSEPRVNYDRIMLSPVLAREKTYEDIIIHDERWYARHGVRLILDDRVVVIDRAAKTVTSASVCACLMTFWCSPPARTPCHSGARRGFAGGRHLPRSLDECGADAGGRGPTVAAGPVIGGGCWALRLPQAWR